MNKISNLLWGIVFITIGLIFGLNALEITNINIFFDGWWTLFIIIPSFIDLFKDKNKTGNIIGIIVGTVLLLGCNNILDFNLIWKLIGPLILIIIGLSFIFKDSLNGKIKHEIKKLTKSTNDEYYATFGSQNLQFNNDEFKGTNLNAIFGGIKCDLQNAKIEQDAVINASAIFGGITILVPNEVNVKIISTPIFGGVSDERKTSSKDSKVTLYINAICMFGGVDIK